MAAVRPVRELQLEADKPASARVASPPIQLVSPLRPGEGMDARNLLGLQRSAGNAAVSRYLAERQVARCAGGTCHCGGACKQPHQDGEHEETSVADVLTDEAATPGERIERAAAMIGRSAAGGQRLQRWALGAAPAPDPGWVAVTDPEHVARVAQAEASIRRVLTSRNCQNYFSGHCSNGAGANALQQAFDNATIYHKPDDDNVFGSSINGTGNIAYNRRSFRIGRHMMASTLLHEMFHTCDPTLDANDELDAENAVEACRMHTPWIDTVAPRSGGAGTRVTIVGWGFGPRQQAVDEVRIAGMSATIVSWDFLTDNSSRVRIVAEVPASSGAGAGAGAGSDIVVINNGVRSNALSFTVT